jgi:hypothetical protein
MRTSWIKVAVAVAFIGINAGAAQAGSDTSEVRASIACQASVPADLNFQAGTSTTTDATGATRTEQVRTIVEGDDLTVVHSDRIEFYRIVGPNQVELIGAIDRPADLTAEAPSPATAAAEPRTGRSLSEPLPKSLLS